MISIKPLLCYCLIQFCSFSTKQTVTPNLSFSSFITELPRFRLFKATIRLYVYKNKQTLLVLVHAELYDRPALFITASTSALLSS